MQPYEYHDNNRKFSIYSARSPENNPNININKKRKEGIIFKNQNGGVLTISTSG